MIYKNNFGVIDSQDAVIGNKAYDLASLIDDVRYQTSNNLKNKIYKNYITINKNNLNIKNFKNDFDILSVLRNLKIIGIFIRLAKRDKKNKYLKLIPHTWKLIEMRLRDNPLLKDLKNILDKKFFKSIKKKNMEIKTALILCAGYGKRLNPLTLDTPKPLIKLNNITLLENTINLISSLGIQKKK